MEEEKKDKAEKDLDLASDFEWVRALDASGKSIRIAKADMVELIRANMPVAVDGIKGLLNYENLLAFKGDTSDCNNGYHGIYRANRDTINAPISILSAGILISLVCYVNDSYKFQLFFDLLGEPRLYYRRKTDQYWTAWNVL